MYINFKNRVTFKEINDFSNIVNDEHFIIKDKELTLKYLTRIKALRKYQHLIIDRLKYTTGITFEERKLFAGTSETAEAWTDCKTYIGIDKDMLNMLDRGFDGLFYLFNLITHEYLHNDSADLHDIEFFEKFHNNVLFKNNYVSITDFSKRCNKYYVRELTKNGFQVSKSSLDLLSIT